MQKRKEKRLIKKQQHGSYMETNLKITAIKVMHIISVKRLFYFIYLFTACFYYKNQVLKFLTKRPAVKTMCSAAGYIDIALISN